MADPIVRFFSHVQKTDTCWIWTSATTGFGYGTFATFKPNKTHKAHRYSWEMVHGKIPAGMCVCHKCDNPICVNPEHLFLGTRSENNKDMHDKGRCAKNTWTKSGEENPTSKLTNEKVLAIREMYSAGNTTMQKVGEVFGITAAHVCNIVRRISWKHI